MPELTMDPDPAFWQILPDVAELASWYEAQVAAAPQGARDAVAGAAALALRARADMDFSEVLLLSDPRASLYAMLGIVALDVPAPAAVGEATVVAEALAPSPWQSSAVPFELGAVSGWRVTAFDEMTAVGDEKVALAQTVSNVYVCSVRGRCVVVLLSSLTALVSAVAQRLAEQVIATFDVDIAKIS